MSDSSNLGGAGLPNIDHGPKLLVATLTVTAVALVSVIARMYVRKFITKSVGWDDIIMVAAMTLSLVSELMVIPDVYYGAGRHAVYITDPKKLSYGLYLNFISQPFFLVAVVLVKVSVGLFLLRLTPARFFHRFIWCMQAFMATYTTIALCTILTQCRPLSVIWDPTVKEAVCFSPMGLRACAYFNAACGITADLVFALLPIPILWKVKINSRVKLALCFILSLGLFATAACCVKVYYLTFFGRYNDFLWDSVDITIWTSCELNIGIFAASIATLRPLFRAAFQGSTAATAKYGVSGDQKSIDKSGFVKHISNSGGVSKSRVGRGSASDVDDDFEMYGSVIAAGRKRVDRDNETPRSLRATFDQLGIQHGSAQAHTAKQQIAAAEPQIPSYPVHILSRPSLEGTKNDQVSEQFSTLQITLSLKLSELELFHRSGCHVPPLSGQARKPSQPESTHFFSSSGSNLLLQLFIPSDNAVKQPLNTPIEHQAINGITLNPEVYHQIRNLHCLKTRSLKMAHLIGRKATLHFHSHRSPLFAICMSYRNP
ncbi:hypothetical protein G7Y89_g1108 [Cudoniella acicularis]|uniref:Rhodopsin domain-containing protein n=1 Tax=Cudoniella acicularis TaxID=354080 RepID=A0A8H4RWQ0_9HELO|nr:hypothetical protein G7Y89_g1108 [Cudoniella acicularis]